MKTAMIPSKTYHTLLSSHVFTAVTDHSAETQKKTIM